MTTTMSSSRPRSVLAWRTVDLLAAAMLGVAGGVAYWGWDFAFNAISPAFTAFPPSGGLVAGVWLLAGVLGGLVVRRPGAALLAELVAANVEYLLGNQWGASTMISGFLQGLGVEVVLALFLYRRFGLGVAALSGALAGVFEAVYEWFSYWTDWTFGWKLIYAGLFAVSGAVIAGGLGWLLTRALARAGALDAFPAGREERERHLVA